MAKRLTEEMVIARTKISDLSKIKRLNCWGSELVDVSLLRKMPCVEVLSLSINKINSLIDFQFCKRLEELYIRQNDLRDLNEVVYLQSLPNLKNLWLGENPCSNIEGYRLAVIKALPQLQKLDNVAVSQEELRDAQRRGRSLIHPEYTQESEEEAEYAPSQANTQYSSERIYDRQRSPQSHETEYEVDESEDVYPREDGSEGSHDYSPPRQTSPPRRNDAAVRRSYSPEAEYVERRRNSYDRESPKQTAPYYEPTQSSTTNNSLDEPNQSCDTTTTNNNSAPSTFKECKIVTSQSTSCIKEYTNGDRYIQAQHYRSEGSEILGQVNDKRERYNCPAAVSHRPPYTRRPVTRNSNILSAVLCLVKELDYPSLEVVEMAVRCRMDELDD